MKLAYAVICTLFFSLVSGLCRAAEAAPVLVVTEESFPLSYLSSDSTEEEVVGLATTLVREVMETAGIDYEINLLPWVRAIKKTETNRNVLIYSIAKTQSRAEKYKWVGKVIELDYWLYGLEASRRIDLANSELDLRDLKVGVVRDDIFHQYLTQQGYKNLVVLESGERLLTLLARGRIDLFPSNSIGLKSFCQRQDFDCGLLMQVEALEEISSALYLAFNKNSDDQLVGRAVAAYERLRQSGRYDEIMSDLYAD